MADGKVSFEIVSPEALVFASEVDMVVVPGAEGDFGVLPGHAPFLSTLRPGVIDVYEGDRIESRIFVSDGFAEVSDSRCTVLASEAHEVGSLDRAAVETRLASAEEALRDAGADEERARFSAELEICRAMLAALG
jgi:F-type H+-transporting ATPase subunit epsilon